MRRWRFALSILFVAVLLGAAGSARAQSDAELEALNEEVQQLHNAGKYHEAIAVAGRFVEAAKKRHGEDHPNTQPPSISWPSCCRTPTGWPRPSR